MVVISFLKKKKKEKRKRRMKQNPTLNKSKHANQTTTKRYFIMSEIVKTCFLSCNAFCFFSFHSSPYTPLFF